MPWRAWANTHISPTAPMPRSASAQAATAAGREILEEGTKLSVYWPGSDEWFATCILGHRATIEEGVLVFKHRCEYPGGFIEHDLGEVDFELLERPSDMDEIDQENLEAAQLNALDEGLRYDRRTRSSLLRALPFYSKTFVFYPDHSAACLLIFLTANVCGWHAHSESAKPPVVTITGSDKRKRGVLGALHLGGSRRGRKDVALVSEQRA